MERNRGLVQVTVGLVLTCLIFGSSNSYALEQPQLSKRQVEATQWTFDMFLTKWKSMYQVQVSEISKLAGVPISQYKFKNDIPKEPMYIEGSHKANEDALNDYATRIASWFAIEKSSIEPKGPTSDNKVLPFEGKYDKGNCELLVKELQNERVLYFNEVSVLSYMASKYNFRESIPTSICVANDVEGNQKRYMELGAALKKWVGFEISNFSYSRLVFENLPPLDLVGKITSEEKFFEVIDGYRNSRDSLKLMNSDIEKLDRYVDAQPKITDVSYGYQHKIPEPRRPVFESGNPSGNFSSTVIWGYLYQKWVSDQLEIDDRLIFTKQVNPGQQKRQCEGQSSANTYSFTLMRSAIRAASDATQIQSTNKDLNDKNLNAVEISKTLRNIKKALETYSEKLPVYLERDPLCVIYKVQMSELEVLFSSLEAAEDKLENLQDGDLRGLAKYQEKSFDRKIDQAVESTKKAVSQKDFDRDSRGAMPLICGKDKGTLKLTHNGKRCPSGLIEIKL